MIGIGCVRCASTSSEEPVTVGSAKDAHTAELNELLSTLPLKCVDYAFAYGSGVVPQKKQGLSANMVDFVVSVRDAEQFHIENLMVNSRHYSAIKRAGPEFLARFQNNYAAKVYCNTLVRSAKGGRQMKYSVIETRYLMADLLDWETLYISGRLHKPVLTLISPSGDRKEELGSALAANRKFAVHSALLLLPENFALENLYSEITALSYTGDFRTIFGEDKNKIENIVSANIDRFDDIYLPIVSGLDRVVVSGRRVEQDLSESAVYHNLNLLPTVVLWKLQHRINFLHTWNRDLEEVIFTVAHRRDFASLVKFCIAFIVRRSAITQSCKNVATAGLWKTVVYSGRKIKKMFKSIIA